MKTDRVANIDTPDCLLSSHLTNALTSAHCIIKLQIKKSCDRYL